MLLTVRHSVLRQLGMKTVTFIGSWPHEVEIDEHAEIVRFYDKGRDWMVGYTFKQMQAASRQANFSPPALRRLVEAHMESTKRHAETGRVRRTEHSPTSTHLGGDPYSRGVNRRVHQVKEPIVPMILRQGREEPSRDRDIIEQGGDVFDAEETEAP